MIESRYTELQDVITAAEFPELDLALRRGQHIDREDFALFTLLTEAQDHLEAFYRRYGCELVHKADGYFYLLPTGDKLSRRQLTPADMLVGQALALLYLAPSTIERGGRTTQEDVVAQLVVVLGSETLTHAFNPKQKRRVDERVAQKNVRARIGEGIRHLAALGFVDVAEDDSLRLRPSLLRFAEPVRGLSEPAEALAKLVATGEVALVTDAVSELDNEGDELEDDFATMADADGDAGANEELGMSPPATTDPTEHGHVGSSMATTQSDRELGATTTATATATAFASLLSPASDHTTSIAPSERVVARAVEIDDDDPPYVYEDADEDS